MRPAPGGTHFEFDGFRLETAEPLLLRNGHRVHLTPKVFGTLLFLVRRAGRAVSKTELMESLWPGVAVEENNLNQHVSLLRKILGERPGGGPYIETVRGYGYRFSTPVREVPDWEPAAAAAPEPARIEAGPSSGRPAVATRPRPTLLTMALAIGALSAAGLYVAATTAMAPESGTAVIVPAFRTIGGDGGGAHVGRNLSRGISQRLRAEGGGRLRVTAPPAPESAARAGTQPGPAPAPGGDFVLDGQVAIEGARLHVRAHLLDASDGAPRWTGTFEADVAGLATLVRRVAAGVVEAIESIDENHANHANAEINAIVAGAGPAVAGPDPRATARALEARGRYFWNRRTSEGLYRSIAYFEQAIAADPGYASAYAGLAMAYAFDGEHWSRAEPLAAQALALDPQLADAHAALGFVRMFWQWRWDEADRAFRLATAAPGATATSHQWYALFFAARGRTIEAEAEIRRALALDPLSPIIRADFGQILYYNGEHDQAIARCREALEADPALIAAHMNLYEIYTLTGRYDDAIETFFRISDALPGHPLYSRQLEPALRASYATEGITGFWQVLLRTASDHGLAYSVAEYAARLGDAERALPALQEAYEDRQLDLAFVHRNPVFRPLKKDPRYQAVLVGVGVPGRSAPDAHDP